MDQLTDIGQIEELIQELEEIIDELKEEIINILIVDQRINMSGDSTTIINDNLEAILTAREQIQVLNERLGDIEGIPS